MRTAPTARRPAACCREPSWDRFRYAGTRSDDPNDLVPHEHRRELRALRVFGAWTNLVDWKAGNTLDTLIEENGRTIVKHYLQDVGSSLGMANNEHEWDMGWEYYYDAPPTRKRFLTFGFALSPWQTVPYVEYPSVNIFEGDRFDPTTWKPQTPVTAYIELRADDAFWAARRVMAFSDDLIRAAVHTGEFSDSAAEAHLAAVLIKRRDAIGRAYLPAINPIVDPRLDAAGQLTFANAAVAAGVAEAPTEYHAAWFRFDNATAGTQPIGETRGATASMAAPADAVGDRAGRLRGHRSLRRERRAPVMAAAGARVLPAIERRLEAGRPRAAARRAGSDAARAAGLEGRPMTACRPSTASS